MDTKNILEIYTDGSCIGNPGPGGWAAVLLLDKRKIILKGNEKDTTNNRMEMTAVIHALKFIHENNLQKKIIKIFSDSNLIIQTVTKSWKKKMNRDLWEVFDEFRRGLDIEWKWVKAHDVNVYNNEADRNALSEAKKILRQ